MRIKVFTLFPEMLRPALSQSILGRAVASGRIDVELINIRDYTLDRHRRTDDYPFGGGAGMVMSAQPIIDAFAARCPAPFEGRRIYLSPRGRTLTQRVVEELAGEEQLALLCGHYEGVDQRALDAVIDEELSIGDYVLTGGELGALVVIDAVSRLLPGVLGSDESSEDESFSTGLLEYPQYTRPAVFRGEAVPQVLLDGNHADIAAWRREQSLSLTLERRPALLDGAPLNDADRAMLARLKRANGISGMLNDLGVPCARRPLGEANLWPKRWFAAFVPPERRGKARRACLPGRGREGRLWNAFAKGYAECVSGEAAWRAWAERAPVPCELYLPEDGLLFELPQGWGAGDDAFEGLGVALLADPGLTVTFARTRVAGEGPYFARAAEAAER